MSFVTQPILDFKSASLYTVRLVLQSPDTTALQTALHNRLESAGDFFEGEPVVIDALALEQAPDWAALAQTLQQHQMPVVGVAANDPLHESIRQSGLTVVRLPAGRDTSTTTGGSIHRDPPASDLADAPAPASGGAAPNMNAPAIATGAQVRDDAAELVSGPGLADSAPESPAASGNAHRPTLILDRSLRSGQRVYARDADLIVVGMVSPGAEVIADGNIHVYGPLRGKAMAGARGDEAARIFTTRLDAELVAVAGVYRVVETQLPADLLEKAATVRLQEGGLRIEALAV